MGRLTRVSGVTVDITERKKIEEHQLLLAREVDHRARNALAVVQAIVRLTRANSQEAYTEAVEGRIHALAQAHTLLSESRWEGADVGTLVAEELAPYRSGDGARVASDGPALMLSPEKAQNLALALPQFTGQDQEFEEPLALPANLVIDTEKLDYAASLAKLHSALKPRYQLKKR